ncbi:TonB-dependent receptor [Tenacibaculum aiptasiae]|uniref:TonB-dependent receptor n=1 Tax=Tenacibaculum aiptasiae TaxID=426481 RepID=A0A7J5AQB7_9FLAO|nr:outer membrane beta-barrel family protein [Tenacibaculum aiptasiae]KAB1159815.1 TonB-dependent receptor [Tenacibaculum aiptasiae]
MKKLLLTILFAVIAISNYAQKQEITGKVINPKNKASIPYATITCKSENGTIITGAITNDDGYFTLSKLPKTKLLLSFQFIGYKTLVQSIDLTEKDIKYNIGTIYLQEDNNQLNEVEIQAESSTVVQKIDRKIINVNNDLIATGASSLEMLENIPSVDIDHLSGTVSLRGNENVSVLINGKPSNINTEQLLKQLPSNSVKSIEIITNPSAKFNPEGMSGIINIILKKNTEIGFNGSITIGIKHSKNTKPDIALNTNYKVGITNFYANYSTSWGDYETFNNLQRTDKDLLQNIDFLNNSSSHFFKIGVDINLNSKSILSLYTDQNFDNNSLATNTLVTQNSNTQFNNLRFSKYKQKDETYNIDYVYNFDKKGQSLELEFNYSSTNNPENTINSELIDNSSKENNYTNNILDTRKLWLFNIDYTIPIQSGKIEFGLEYRKQNFYNKIITDQEAQTSNSPTLQPIGNTSLDYDRSIYSGYFNFNKEYEKIAFQIGFRVEQFNLDASFFNTNQGNTNLKDNLFNIYPSASINYSLSEKDNIQLAYSRRVDRPSAYQVTPIQEWASPLTIARGNRNLTPQFTNSIELNYTKTITKGYISLGTFYRRTNDKIGRILERDALNPDKSISSFTNYDFADSYGIELSSSFKPIKWWTLRPSFETYIQDSQGILNNQFETIKNTITKARISNSFKASKKLSFQFSTIYRGKSENIQYTVQPYTMVNIGARLKVLDGKGKISIRGTDIFNNVNFDYTTNNPFNQKGKYILEYDSIYLGFSYNFGSSKNKRKGRKYRDNNESQGGIF